MGNQNGIYDQDFAVSDVDASHSQDSSERKQRRLEKGYVSDVRPASTRRKKTTRKYVSQHPISASSSSSTPVLPAITSAIESKRKIVNWWKKLNGNALRKDSHDYFFLLKNSKLIDELLNDFQDIMDMLMTNIKQIEEIDPDERMNSVEPNILKMLNEINSFYIDDVSKMLPKHASKVQKTVSYRFISQMMHRLLDSEVKDATKRFNVMELVFFYYDYFYTSFAVYVRCNDNEIDGYEHPIFDMLFKNNNRNMKSSRSRMNGSERMAAGLFIDLCMELKKKYIFDFENDTQFSIEMVFPPHLFNVNGKYPFKSAEEEKNAMIMANVLHIIGAPIKEIEKSGVRVLKINRALEELFGENTYKNVNDVLLFNIECISELLSNFNSIWYEIVSKWNRVYSRVVSHSPENALSITKENFEKPNYLHTELIEFDYKVYVQFMQWMHKFYVSCEVKLDEIYYMKPDEDNLIKKNTINYVEDLMASTLQTLRMELIDTKQYRKLPQHMLLIWSMLKSKSYISSFISMSGMLKLNAKRSDRRDFGFILYREIRPSILSIIALNFRFFPIFDILVTLAYGDEGLRNLRCHLNFEYMSSLSSINNIKYDTNEKRVVINFPITVKQLKQTIIQNGKSATNTKKLPSKQENLFIPFSWKDEDKVPIYFREKIQKDYRKSGEFSIQNLRIASFTTNDVLKNACVVINTSQPVEKMCITYSAIKDNRMASSTSAMSIVQGTSIVFKDDIKQEISTEMKEFVINNINNSDVLKNENITGVHRCVPTKAKIKMNNFTTFVHKETQIECIQSFNIALVIDTKTIHQIMEQWMSLYFHWPIATSKALIYHSMPSI